jgi:hypothetical protein
MSKVEDLQMGAVHSCSSITVDEHNFLLSFASHYYQKLTIDDVNWWNKNNITHNVVKKKLLTSPNDVLIESKKNIDDITQFILEKFYNYTLYGNNDKNPFNKIIPLLNAVYLDKWDNEELGICDVEDIEVWVKSFMEEIEPMIGAKIKYFVHNWMEEDFERLRKEIFEKEAKEV